MCKAKKYGSKGEKIRRINTQIGILERQLDFIEEKLEKASEENPLRFYYYLKEETNIQLKAKEEELEEVYEQLAKKYGGWTWLYKVLM